MATIMDFLGKVAGVQRQRHTERVENYRQLVESIDAGKKLDPAHVCDVLEAVGKSLNDLQADLDLIANRRKWKAQAARYDEFLAENNRVAALFDPTDEEFTRKLRELKAAYNAKKTELAAQHTAAMNGMNEAQTARNKLIETSDQYRDFLAVNAERGQAMREIENELAVTRRQAEAHVMAARAKVRNPGGISADQAERNLKSAEAWLAQIDEKIAANKRIADRARKQSEQLETQMVAQ